MSGDETAIEGAYRHDAVFYSGEAEFVETIGSFLESGVGRGARALALVTRHKADLLKSRLGPVADSVEFGDIFELGENPARIIPQWRSWLDEASAEGSPLIGVGEPIWAERTSEQMVESHNHEALLNLAFSDVTDFWLRCPYDASTLNEADLERARTTHPSVIDGDGEHHIHLDVAAMAAETLSGTLPKAPGEGLKVDFSIEGLHDLRELAAKQAVEAGVSGRRVEDFVLAVSEIATNSLQYGSGSGAAHIWQGVAEVVCEIRDSGRIIDPLIGRRPPAGAGRGYGTWISNQVCDLVQIRSGDDGTVVRLHQRT